MNLFSAIDDIRGDIRGGDGWRILRGDCLKLLPQLPGDSADLIFADPPYNLQLKNELYRPNMTRVSGVSDSWDKFNSFADYDLFCEAWLRECRRVLKPDGAIWVIGTYHNISRLGRLLQDLGFWMQNDVIWQKSNPMPNFRGVRFTNATETLLWAKKSEKGRAMFNHRAMKRENGGKQMTNVWTFPVCGGGERLRDSAGVKLHSTQKPLSLLRRILLATTKPGDVVLDPFLGSGTTAAAARQLGRIAIGVEKENRYADIAAERIAAVVPEMLDEEDTATPPRRVPFSELLTRGLVHAGQSLQSRDGRNHAQVLADGHVKVNGTATSIHKAGAKIVGAPSCNGWNFWYIKSEGGELVSINSLREQVRQGG